LAFALTAAGFTDGFFPPKKEALTMKRRRRNARHKSPPPLPHAVLTEAQQAGLLPLDYLLGVMRDASADPTRRDRAAICLAQYLYPRAADYRRGKKEVEAAAAKRAGSNSEWGDDLRITQDGRPRQ
jgi:hypothetical protein